MAPSVAPKTGHFSTQPGAVADDAPMSFRNLVKQLRVSAARTARFELNTVDSGGRTPALILRHAGEGNPGYVNAVLAKINSDRSGKAGGRVTLASLAEDREADLPLFSHHVVVGWEHVYEDDGKPADCTPAKVEELLRLVIESDTNAGTAADVFDKIRAFARNAENFRGHQDAEALGKG